MANKITVDTDGRVSRRDKLAAERRAACAKEGHRVSTFNGKRYCRRCMEWLN
jgi:hypothetical protein